MDEPPALTLTLLMRIIKINPDEVAYPFEGKPSVSTRPLHTSARTLEVDTFPAYAHDVALVQDTADLVSNRFPIEFETTIYVLPHELPSRCNGHATRDYIWHSKPCKCGICETTTGDGRTWEPYIVLQAKRIPPHPAMTRYLVSHEYGHVVQYWIEHVRKAETGDLEREYMELRPGTTKSYGGGRWHQNVGELFANDFRILVCGHETEFWPHPGFPHPYDVPAVQEFWREAVEKFPYREAKAPREKKP